MDFYIPSMIIVQAFICGPYAAHVADQKGYSHGHWFAAGFFFGILGLIAAAGLPLKNDALPGTVLTRLCPDCLHTVRLEVTVCPTCGRSFSLNDLAAGVGGLEHEYFRPDIHEDQRERLLRRLLTANSFEELAPDLEGASSEFRNELKRRFRDARPESGEA